MTALFGDYQHGEKAGVPEVFGRKEREDMLS